MDPARPHILALQSSLEVGGIEKVSLALAANLADRYRFSVLAFDRGGRLAGRYARHGAAARVVPRRPGIDAAYPFRLAREIRRIGTDLLHVHNETALFYGRFAAAVAGGTPVVYTEHDRTFPGRPHLHLLNRMLARRCAAVTTVSARLRRQLVRHEGGVTERIRVILSGVDPRPFLAGPTRREVREEFGLPGRARLVLSAGRLAPEKGFDLLLEAAPAVVHAVPDTFFLVAGEGPDRASLERAMMPGRVVLAGERDDVPRLMLAADVIAIPSRSEGLPLAAIEAAAAGRPVVAADVGALAEVVVDGVTGRLVPPGDRGALIGTLCALLSNPGLRRRMGRAAAERFLARFTVDRMVREYAEVYDAVLRGAG